MVSHLLYLFMARDSVLDKMASLLASDGMPARHMTMLKDLHFVLNVAIPVVMHTDTPHIFL